jgi:hypothetical protein
MFNCYSDSVSNAQTEERKIIDKYSCLRENLSMEFKEKLSLELENVEKDYLSKYSPITFHNNMTILVKTFQKLEEDKNIEIEELKSELNRKLLEFISPEQAVKEMGEIQTNRNGARKGLR